jgi:hypothetical protein
VTIRTYTLTTRPSAQTLTVRDQPRRRYGPVLPRKSTHLLGGYHDLLRPTALDELAGCQSPLAINLDTHRLNRSAERDCPRSAGRQSAGHISPVSAPPGRIQYGIAFEGHPSPPHRNANSLITITIGMDYRPKIRALY